MLGVLQAYSCKSVSLTDIYLMSEDCWCDLDDVCMCLRREHNLNVEVLADLLEAAYFSPSDDSDADSYETLQRV